MLVDSTVLVVGGEGGGEAKKKRSLPHLSLREAQKAGGGRCDICSEGRRGGKGVVEEGSTGCLKEKRVMRESMCHKKKV